MENHKGAKSLEEAEFEIGKKLLDELKVEADKLQKLLNADEVGLFTWWQFLAERLNKIKEISKKLGIE